MTLIDLGDAAAAPPVAAPVNWSRLRRLMLAALTVAGLLATAASGPAAAHPLRATALPAGDTLALDGRTAYLTGPSEVSAYDLGTGRRRWQVPAAAADGGVRPAGDVVLAPGPVALDAATGAPLWRSSGDARPSAASGDVLLAERDQLRLVGLRDGHERWRRAVSPVDQWTTVTEGGRPSVIVTVSALGDATAYRYADGVVLHRERIPWNGVYRAYLATAGPYLVVVRTASAQTVATVYRAADLRPLWRSGELIGSVTDCGGLICLAGVRGVTAHDAGTGQEIWQRDDMTYVADVGDGRLLLSSAASTVLADAATGRTVGRPFAGRPSVVTGPAGSLLLLRETGTPAGRTTVTRLDLSTGGQAGLGTIERTAGQVCRGTPGYLLCPRGDELSVTAIG
ncbi:PQQ-binding-like beta-propeller repeat protein [Actinoplanes sp. NPDC049596]|uniref:outer membrane protein assembly factor BamB family protein n=1 Tax=unclassified Actinoplanes TaxID=2626549 RepID=UPI0034482680